MIFLYFLHFQECLISQNRKCNQWLKSSCFNKFNKNAKNITGVGLKWDSSLVFLDFDENKLRLLGFFLLNVSAGEVVFLDVLGPND